MSLSLLFKDELRGFYKSKVMLVLWAGLPLLAIILRLTNPDTGGIPFTTFSAILVSSIGGTLAAVMLAVSIINEKDKKVYDLFLIRPIKRRNLLLSKFLAVYLCISIASIIALITGVFVDVAGTGALPEAAFENSLKSIVTGLSMMAISSSAGILIGTVSPSVLIGAVLVIYGGNQISIIPSLPAMLELEHQLAFTVIFGLAFTIILMTASIVLFEKKQF